MTDKPTVHRETPEDRTEFLRDLLQHPMTKEDLVPAVREMARLMVSMHSEISAMPDLRNNIARLEKLFLDFMEDQLVFRQQREEKELAQAKEKAQQAGYDLNRTSQKIKAIQLTGRTGVPMLLEKLTTWVWFRDRVLPYLTVTVITLVTALIGNAIWVYFKFKLGIP